MKKLLVTLVVCLCGCLAKTHAQWTDGTTGLLHMPNAEMQQELARCMNEIVRHEGKCVEGITIRILA